MTKQLTLFAEASHARTYRWPVAARDWLESVVDYGMSSIALLQAFARDGLLSKMSPAYYPAIEGETLPSSFNGWQNAGMAWPGGFLTLSISEWPSAAVVCSLSQVLEADVAPKYYLSPRAAAGILRRAEKRGKELPEQLRGALEVLAGNLKPNPTSPTALITQEKVEEPKPG